MGARDMSRDSPRYQENTPGCQGNSAGYHSNSNTTASYHDNFTYYLDYHDEYFSAFTFSETEETTDEVTFKIMYFLNHCQLPEVLSSAVIIRSRQI